MSKQTVVTEMCTFRIQTEVVDHLAHAAKVDDRTKTSIVHRALKSYLDQHYPLGSIKVDEAGEVVEEVA